MPCAAMDPIAVTPSDMLDRQVPDQTGLAGRYDFRIKFDPGSGDTGSYLVNTR
jgi:uncharacterized protein (TIGR03435 family)